MRWCFTDRTALAEAELEYEERADPAIDVAFELEPGAAGRFAGAEAETGRPVFAVIWTTTPWTIPSNVAIAVHPDETYHLLDAAGRLLVVAEKLLAPVSQRAGWNEPRLSALRRGRPSSASVPPPLPRRPLESHR